MSYGKQTACFGAFCALLKEVALFISNKNPKQTFNTFPQVWDPAGNSACIGLLLPEMICHLNANKKMDAVFGIFEIQFSNFKQFPVVLCNPFAVAPSPSVKRTPPSTTDESDNVQLHYSKCNSRGSETAFLCPSVSEPRGCLLCDHAVWSLCTSNHLQSSHYSF